MSHRLGKEKFYLALLDLVAPGDIHSRVSSSLSQHLLHIKKDEDLPDAARNDYASFINSLNIDSSPGGHVTEIINSMSEVEVEKVAQKIVSLYEKVISG